MQSRLQTLSILEPMTLVMERTLTRKAMWIRVRAMLWIGILSLRNLVSLGLLPCIFQDSLGFLCLGESSILDHDLNIIRPFAMKLRNNLTDSTFNEMVFTFPNAGMESLAKTKSHVRTL